MRIHQIVVSAAPGDAITNAAMDLRASLRRLGPSEVFAAFVDPALTGEAHTLSDFPRVAGLADLVVVHVSIGEPVLTEFLADRAEPLAVVYHNMSPAEAFEPWEPRFARLLDEGRRELADLARRACVAVGVSSYNAAELQAAGFDPVHVVPLAVDVAALVGGEADPAMTRMLAGLDGPVVLSVGQLLPHKRPDWTLMAYHVLVTHLVPEAWLVMVGPDRLAGYGAALRDLVRRLSLGRVHITGAISQAALVSCYRRAEVFMTASEHEGFCVPLLEALAFGVPVVARGFAAVPETLAGAGMVLEPEDGLMVAAEALREVLEVPALRASMVEAGRRRLGSVPAPAARSAMIDVLVGALGPPS